MPKKMRTTRIFSFGVFCGSGVFAVVCVYI